MSLSHLDILAVFSQNGNNTWLCHIFLLVSLSILVQRKEKWLTSGEELPYCQHMTSAETHPQAPDTSVAEASARPEALAVQVIGYIVVLGIREEASSAEPLPTDDTPSPVAPGQRPTPTKSSKQPARTREYDCSIEAVKARLQARRAEMLRLDREAALRK